MVRPKRLEEWGTSLLNRGKAPRINGDRGQAPRQILRCSSRDDDSAEIALEWQVQHVGGNGLTHKQRLKADGSTDILHEPPRSWRSSTSARACLKSGAKQYEWVFWDAGYRQERWAARP